ncbi:DNA polymerase [Rhizobium sp. RU20A]|uniref:UdgX family uracil-DNA binding protein n=1 Tax=Rhizobium sp. RU20A TaxID=1907412 RepID=UPI00095502A7|nr:UdgX family uracil-DNA binding protein [Rhizobium sp. RU20A]SIQ25247.1 DNA polymerase [Rhizobium sp. RU20A]
MHRIVLKGRGDLAEWRDAARGLLARKVAPSDVEWLSAAAADDLFAGGFGEGRGAAAAYEPAPAAGATVTVPGAFMPLAETVLCHSDPQGFALLYRLLVRLQSDRRLLQVASDADVVLAHRLAKAVRRDSHKMTAFVRFKEVSLPPETVGRRRFLAWFEPDHFIVARMAPFFRRRFADMDWVIVTPKGSASWDGERLSVSDLPAEKPDLDDATDDLWRTYYAAIFNPARLKVGMMQKEMPKKYWKNLPEAALIPDLIASAERRVIEMAARAPTAAPAFHARIRAMEAAREQEDAAVLSGGAGGAATLPALRAEAATCTRCPIHCGATQTVFGEGPERADVMFVGEQPGDEEDLAGRPFIGPAGKVLTAAMQEAGLDRSRIYMTNAVKHFKYEPRGKRRIHQRPTSGEVEICRWWLSREIDLVQPKLIVALGATALLSLTGETGRLGDLRGRPLPMAEGRTLFVTVHPAYLLRIPDAARKAEEQAAFAADLRMVRGLLHGLNLDRPVGLQSTQRFEY